MGGVGCPDYCDADDDGDYDYDDDDGDDDDDYADNDDNDCCPLCLRENLVMTKMVFIIKFLMTLIAMTKMVFAIMIIWMLKVTL